MNYATVTLLSNKGLYVSFTNSTGKVGFNADFSVKMSDINGSAYKIKTATTFDLEIDPSSTAIEGVHYEFVNNAQVTVPANKYEGSFSIKLLKKEVGKDKIILHFGDKTGFATGNIPTLTIELSGPDVFTGTWAFSKINNLELFESYGVDITGAPKGTAADQITFEGTSYEEYTFIPNLKGDFKNYFGTSTRKVTFKDEVDKNFQELAKDVKVYSLEFPDINVGFSATDINIRNAPVCFRLIEVNKEEVLECTLDDYEPKGDTFGSFVYEVMGDMTWCPFRIYFTRVN